MLGTASKSNVSTNRDMACYHCGDDCANTSIAVDQKIFCCHGCKMVYSILNENGLATFYELNEKAGASQKGRSKQSFEFLDDPETVAKLISFMDEEITKIQFYIPQIHCSSCLWLLENLHILNEHVTHSRVNFLKKEAQITFKNDGLTLRKLVELLSLIGYPPHIILDDLDQDKRPITDKSLYYKLGLAGFAFGNIMLLSFPDYLGLETSPDSMFNRYISYIIVGLTLPVIFYSGWGYFRSAYQGLRQRHLNIDVPVSLGIAALFIRSIYEIFTQTGVGYLDSLAGLIFFLLIGKWFQQTTYARIAFDRDFKSYFPIACTVVKEGVERQCTLDKLNKGDRVIIRHGELIPADAVLIKGEAQIDYSFVTGESALIDKNNGDLLYAGGRQMGGLIEITITKNVSNSYLTQLWNDHTFSKENSEGTVSAIADRVAAVFTWAILIIGFSTLLYWLPKDAGLAINAFTAVLIIACPCAVALSIPFTFGNVVRLLARKHVYLKNVQVIEAIARIGHVVFDKTGTITTVEASQLDFHGQPLTTYEEQLVYSLARHSTHPLSRQIESKYRGSQIIEVESFQEVKGMGVLGIIHDMTVRLGSTKYIEDAPADWQGVVVEIDGEVKGVFHQKSVYRPGLSDIVTRLDKKASLSILSGDTDGERTVLAPMFKADHMHFNQKPVEKLNFIKSLQTENEVVAMIGDGLNDAGALSQSDVGIVITENTSNFTPASDIIMDAAQFTKLPDLFSFSTSAIKLVYAAYAIALCYNIIGLSYAVQGLLSPVIAAILMPLSSITIVLFGVMGSSYVAWRKGFL